MLIFLSVIQEYLYRASGDLWWNCVTMETNYALKHPNSTNKLNGLLQGEVGDMEFHAVTISSLQAKGLC